MTDTEFLSRLPEGVRKPTDKEFEAIQFVYDFHPSISSINGKEEIALLYKNFGMRIIYDMHATAEQAKRIGDERRACHRRLDELEKEYKMLAWCEE